MKSLNTIFLNAVERWPDCEALYYNGTAWTYLTLYQHALRYAKLIQQKTNAHITDPGCIAIWGEKTLMSIAAILGTLLAGKTYTCLDLSFPANRIQHILDLANPSLLLLTERSLFVQNQLIQLKNTPVIIDLTNFNAEDFSSTAFVLEKEIDLRERIAYLVFTSGSTGIPKGVCVSHRAAVSAIVMFNEHIHLKQTDIIANQSALCYDLSMFDLFSAFSVGASLHLISPFTIKVPKRFIHYLLEYQLSSLFIVTSTVEYLLKYTLDESYQLPLRYLLLTGEPISENIIALLKKKLLPSIIIWNLYSATEMPYAFAQRIYLDVPSQPLKSFNQHGSQIRFGLKNSILNNQNHQIGELYVESPVNFSGYLTNDNDLASIERYPIKEYLTGDLARLNDSGIELYGRIDRQIKILGNRVELDDIEIMLESISIVREAAIDYDKDQQKIIAFISLINFDMDNALIKIQLISDCQKSLPPIMHPHEFLFVKNIPRTVSGKKNRKLLMSDRSMTSISSSIE